MTITNGLSNGSAPGAPNGATATMGKIPVLPLSYDSSDTRGSTLRLIGAVRPEWDMSSPDIKIIRCTDGITNTLLKVVNEVKGASAEETDREAILLRAYGNGTHVIIDRQREAENHGLLMSHGLAPELLARFNNGMLYRFMRGTVTTTEDLRNPAITTAVATRLAEWHARVPCVASVPAPELNGKASEPMWRRHLIDTAAPTKPPPNVWTVMQKWIFALPTDTEQQRQRQDLLQAELDELISNLSQRPGIGENGVSRRLPLFDIFSAASC
jgi:ethanolamine kinase